jgi:glycosyltransferase involved in cell wall biosynthesis
MNRTIAFFYIDDDNWTGGQDYVVNAINALNFLDISKQPKVEILVDEKIELFKLKKRITYTNYKIYKIRTHKNIFIKYFSFFIQKFRWEYVYPFPKASHYNDLLAGVSLKRRIYWIPDFQEEYFPDLFGKEVVEKRRNTRKWLANQKMSTVVFSSNNARNDFFKLYGPNVIAKTRVLNFANPNEYYFSQEQRNDTLNNYGLESGSFFICPNQFWKHKNHSLVIDGVRRIHEMGHSICLVFCGKEQDPRDLDYFPMLRASAEDLVKLGVIKFLGFLPKDDQMCLISESKALIQPSMFEGWSTTIEDAISLNKIVVATDLEVNIEQLGDLGKFFVNNDVISLVEVLNTVLQTQVKEIQYSNKNRLSLFANNIKNLLN